MYQNLPLCKKHDSYTCRAALRNFVGNIPALLSFVRKIPTHDIMCGNNSYKCRNYSYICRNNYDSYTARKCLTLCAKCRNLSYKIQQCGNISYKILAKFSIKYYTCRNHASYTFFPALYLIMTISYLVWNMFCSQMLTSMCKFSQNYVMLLATRKQTRLLVVIIIWYNIF